jgi:subtilisin
MRAILLGTALLPFFPNATAAISAPGEPHGYVVTLAPGAGDVGAVVDDHVRNLGVVARHVYRHALAGYAADVPATALAVLEADPRVATVKPEQVFAATARDLPIGVDRIDADLSRTADIDGVDQPRADVDVAVLDTGIDPKHPDLNVVGGHDCRGGIELDDPDGHGTHVAGVIGGLDNGVGVVGVAPGARLWAVRVLDRQKRAGTGELLCGIDWVTGTRLDGDRSNDIEVVNLSMHASGRDDGACGRSDGNVVHQAICRSVEAGVTYVVSAGNDSTDARHFVPAAFGEVITVSALADSDGKPGGEGGRPECRDDLDDTLADFSNTGRDVDLIAPGVCVLSTEPLHSVRTSGEPQEHLDRLGYGVRSGTSSAAPHVAGAAAVYLVAHPEASPSQVRAALQAEGSRRWDDGEDVDGVQEPLVNIAKL